MHVRRRDFEGMCGDTPQSECFATLPIYARRVIEVRDELQRKGEDVKYVIMTSDERDPAWWAEVAALGWYRIDFEALHTEELYGKWWGSAALTAVQGHVPADLICLQVPYIDRCSDPVDGCRVCGH